MASLGCHLAADIVANDVRCQVPDLARNADDAARQFLPLVRSRVNWMYLKARSHVSLIFGQVPYGGASRQSDGWDVQRAASGLHLPTQQGDCWSRIVIADPICYLTGSPLLPDRFRPRG